MNSYQKKKLKVCQCCKHHVSIHEWNPDAPRNSPPMKCKVPGCYCVQFDRVKPKSQ